MKMTQLSIMISPGVLDYLRKQAKEKDVSLAVMVRHYLKNGIGSEKYMALKYGKTCNQ